MHTQDICEHEFQSGLLVGIKYVAAPAHLLPVDENRQCGLVLAMVVCTPSREYCLHEPYSAPLTYGGWIHVEQCNVLSPRMPPTATKSRQPSCGCPHHWAESKPSNNTGMPTTPRTANRLETQRALL